MSRHKTPSNILEARGAFKKHPDRKPKGEPQPSAPFPKDPPAHLTRQQRATWREIVKICPDGVLTGSDKLIVEIAATLLAQFRAAPDSLGPTMIGRLTAELGKLGLSPSDRTKISVLIKRPNKFDDF